MGKCRHGSYAKSAVSGSCYQCKIEELEDELKMFAQTPVGQIFQKNKELEVQLEHEAERMARAASDILRLGNEANKLQAQLERVARWAFEQGYGAGHNDTVEGMFSLDEETMSEDWLAEVKSDGSWQQALENDRE